VDKYRTWEDNLLEYRGSLLKEQMSSIIKDARIQVQNDQRIGTLDLRERWVKKIDKLTKSGAVADPAKWENLAIILFQA
jgi:hypothetical protein